MAPSVKEDHENRRGDSQEPRIENRHFGGKVARVPGDHDQVMMQGGGGEKAVQQGQLAPSTLVASVEHRPFRKNRAVERKYPTGSPPFESPVPSLDLVTPISRIEQMDALQHLAQRKGAEAEVRVVVPNPRDDLRIGPCFRRLAKDIGINEIGHRVSAEIQVARHLLVAFDLPILHRTVEEDVGESFRRLEPRIRFSGNDHRHRTPVPGDGLRPFGRDSVDQLAELVFCFLERPRGVHQDKITEKSGLSR